MVAVTGACGHVGANLTRALLKEGREVRALVREDRRALEGLGVQAVRADILDPPSLVRAFRGVRSVYHLAAHISLSRTDNRHTLRANVEGTRNVIDACLQCGVHRLVYFGSIHSLDPLPRRDPVDETRSLIDSAGGMAYDRSKALAEKDVLDAAASGLDAVVIIPTAIVGPNDFKPSHAGSTLISLLRGRRRVLVEGGFNWVDVRDVVKGAIAAEKRGRCGERYILSGRWLALDDLCRIVDEVAGCRRTRFVVPMWLARLLLPFGAVAGRCSSKRPVFTRGSLNVLRHYRFVSHEKAARELGYRPRPFVETITDTVNWFRDNGYLKKG